MEQDLEKKRDCPQKQTAYCSSRYLESSMICSIRRLRWWVKYSDAPVIFRTSCC